MNDKLINLIEERGPEIAESLRIASTEVYAKILWYVRINGIVELTQVFIDILIIIPWFFISKNIINKHERDDDGLLLFGWTISLAFLIGMGMIWIGIVDIIINSVTKILFPEYYIIGQILEKIN